MEVGAPDFKGEGEMTKAKVKAKLKAKLSSWWERWHLPFLMVLVSLLGVIIILVAYILLTEGKGDWQLLHDIGVGFLVAGILGITVDQVLRRQLAKEAFVASIGYILPDELKEEMKWIYEAHILCIEHIQTCKLTAIDDDTCILNVRTQRRFINVSGIRSLVEKCGVGIDEWFHKTGSSRILSFGYIKGDDKWDAKDESIKKTDCGWEIKGVPAIYLGASDELIVWSEVEEIKRTNDANYWAFEYPTRNPQVTIDAYKGIKTKVQFGYRLPAEQLGLNAYRLSGTLLPHQRIEIRWWREADSVNWKKGGS